MPPSRDTLRDRYRIERELGRGGMAAVYLAQDLKHRRPEHDAAVREGERGLALIKDHRRSEEWFQRITGKPTSSP